MKRYYPLFFFLTLILFYFSFPFSTQAQESVRKERRAIKSGNSLYNNKNYREASKFYEEALVANPESAVARFNLGMAQIRQGLVADTTKQTQEILAAGIENLTRSASIAGKNPKVASLANYNLGNISFNKEDYASAISFYKQALRINPDDDNARRNLRIAQLKQQNQDKNQDKNQNKNQDKDKDHNKNQDKDQNKDQQNKDQNNNQDQNNDKQPPKNEKDMNPQTADQILRAVENKENQTRNRVMRGQGSGQGKEKAGGRGGRKNW